jgi:hypothetical protein
LARLLLGAVLARGRRTVTGWIRAAGLSREYQPCDTTVAAAGKRADQAGLGPGGHLQLADSPLVLLPQSTPPPVFHHAQFMSQLSDD